MGHGKRKTIELLVQFVAKSSSSNFSGNSSWHLRSVDFKGSFYSFCPFEKGDSANNRLQGCVTAHLRYTKESLGDK